MYKQLKINHKIKNMEIHMIAKQYNNVHSLPSVYAIDDELFMKIDLYLKTLCYYILDQWFTNLKLPPVGREQFLGGSRKILKYGSSLYVR
ncbi:hypothetical protein T02_4726 [Trichinella nativa]|uniref:Uncharacterized protein n=1 Tax=Trichinella nativa TaxID=6335 RepID=A0A0V1KNM5_9BILA|nr:hypothetical protein T02_11916 [Trichinella nativa]KRZ48957.1 hypothetical protein T02_4726 [Trichinella nativa]